MFTCAVLVRLLSDCAVAEAQAWAARFPPDPDCKLSIRHGALGKPPDDHAPASLVVHPVEFGTDQPIGYIEARLSRLGGPDSAALSRVRATDTATSLVFDSVAPGRYALMLRKLGYARRIDSLDLEAGANDTVRAAIQRSGDRINHNCRPRGFRHVGESACVTTGEEADLQLDYARRLADPEGLRRLNLPPVDTSRIVLVRDERVCETASHHYGQPDDPPRRVIVIRMDQLYLVYDPFEPVVAGEWNINEIYDRSWRLLVALTS